MVTEGSNDHPCQWAKMYDPVEVYNQEPHEVIMAQNTVKENTAAQGTQEEKEQQIPNTATPDNHERKSKTPSQRTKGVNDAKKAAAVTGTALKSGAKAIENGTKSVLREVIADAAGGATGIITTMVVGGIVNKSLCDAVNIVDNELGKRHPRMVTVKKSFGRRKTMTEDAYYTALAKGKKFKEVETNHFLLEHKQTVDTAVGVASYVMGTGCGIAAGTTTRKAVKGQLGYVDPKQKKVLDDIKRTLKGDCFTEDGQI